MESIVLGGGCFWCIEAAFANVPGVLSAVSGYAGGSAETATYEAVCRGDTGHVEVVRVVFDPALLSLAQVLDIFWRNIDPFDDGGQFADRGSQYRPVMMVADDAQRAVAEQSCAALEQQFGRAVRVTIEPLHPFYPAEGYHQGYFEKQRERYRAYKKGSGREDFLKAMWRHDCS
jgi:methionine-S-sulfoxide reductase